MRETGGWCCMNRGMRCGIEARRVVETSGCVGNMYSRNAVLFNSGLVA